MTLFQFAEGLTDQSVLEALRNRIELKYALHLPLNYPSFDPMAIRDFRKQLAADSTGQQTYQTLIDRLQAFGLLQTSRDCKLLANQVLNAVCLSNNFEIVVEAMLQALEMLASTDAEWLRGVVKPPWDLNRWASSSEAG